MEIIGKVSKGSRMDQVYIPKKRSDFPIGAYVVLKQLEKKKLVQKHHFYGIKYLEPVKVDLIKKVMTLIEQVVPTAENMFIVGSFLDRGFHFNDLDILIVSEQKGGEKSIVKKIKEEIGIQAQIIMLNNKELLKGITTDPLYQMMLSKCVARKRFLYKKKHEMNYKLLDLHLLKSKVLLDNFDMLTGSEKYYLTRNMIAILLFIQQKKLSREVVDSEIKKLFSLKNIDDLKQNMLNKNVFLKKYKQVYTMTFDRILRICKDGAK